VAISFLASCGKYADFTLPPPDPQGPRGPFTWSASPDPVIPHGEFSDVLNPSVIQINGEYQNFYSEYDGKNWTTARATSTDGVHWTNRMPLNLPIDGGIAANGSALANDYWYQSGAPARIALWRDNKTQIVIEPGPQGSFDEFAVADPDVIKLGGTFYMFYLGQDLASRQRLGIARSSDGIRWEKLRSNPILELGSVGSFDESGLGEPAVWTSGGSYWMLYTGRARDERRRIGLARSTDGVHWTKDENFAPIAGDQPWNRAVMCDPSVEITPTGIRVWFGGGDVASPDQGLHGQIGVGILTSR
jgi:predicted GH43/DUF377 family glycosyl hydrolase